MDDSTVAFVRSLRAYLRKLEQWSGTFGLIAGAASDEKTKEFVIGKINGMEWALDRATNGLAEVDTPRFDPAQAAVAAWQNTGKEAKDFWEDQLQKMESFVAETNDAIGSSRDEMEISGLRGRREGVCMAKERVCRILRRSTALKI